MEGLLESRSVLIEGRHNSDERLDSICWLHVRDAACTRPILRLRNR